MNMKQLKIPTKFKQLTQTQTILVVMYLSILAVFCNEGLQYITGPVITVCMSLLVFTDQYYAILAVMLMGNSSLRNVFWGRGQVIYLAFLLLLVRFLILDRKKMVFKRKFVWAAVLMVFVIIHYFLFEDYTSTFIRSLVYFTMYGFSIVMVFNDISGDRKRCERFWMYVALVIAMSAIQCVMFGGISYFEESGGTRFGAVGALAGDPNFSGLYMLIGIVSTLTVKCLSNPSKIAMVMLMVLSIIRTASTTTLMALILVLCIYLLMTKELKRAMSIILVASVVIVIAYQGYSLLPKSLRLESIDFYQNRVAEKIEQFKTGNLSDATTGRSDLQEYYTEYYWDQSALKIIFGGNKTQIEGAKLVSHNTYLDLFIRYGAFIAVVILIVVIKRYWESFCIFYKTKVDSRYFLLKTLFLFFSATVTFFGNYFGALWYLLLLCF